jgi:hypothetical protein
MMGCASVKPGSGKEGATRVPVVWRSVPRWIAARAAAAGSLWLVTEFFTTFAAAAPSGPAGADPALAAREVFQDQGFWWKRIEPRTASTSWLQSILSAALDFFWRILLEIAEWLAKILASLFGGFTGVSSSGAVVVWLIVAALLAWSIWKLCPVIVRWLSGSSPAPGNQAGPTWQTLPEASDLFDKAGQAFRDGMHAEAIRLALLALIARLEKQGLLRYDTTRTNREYQRELRRISEVAVCFGQLALIYERVWYGRASAGRAEAEQAITLCASLINREDLAPE